VARVGADGLDLLPFGVQTQGKEVLVRHPVEVVETFLQFRGFMEVSARQIALTAEPQHLRHAELRGIHECGGRERLENRGRAQSSEKSGYSRAMIMRRIEAIIAAFCAEIMLAFAADRR
jgi:hypothetical protein